MRYGQTLWEERLFWLTIPSFLFDVDLLNNSSLTLELNNMMMQFT